MANDTEQVDQSKPMRNGDTTTGTDSFNEQEEIAHRQIKAYRKKGLMSEKVLLERLSDMSIEDNINNPAITLSSIEDDSETSSSLEPVPMEQDIPACVTRGTLMSSPSLDVPTVNLSQEAKRPPI